MLTRLRFFGMSLSLTRVGLGMVSTTCADLYRRLPSLPSRRFPNLRAAAAPKSTGEREFSRLGSRRYSRLGSMRYPAVPTSSNHTALTTPTHG
jgi:hypothetical protein